MDLVLRPIRGFMDILKESGLKNMPSTITSSGSGIRNNAASGGEGAHRVSPPPIEPSRLLEPSGQLRAGPGGSSAGDRGTERLNTGGPRNSSMVMSSSRQDMEVGPAATLLDNVQSQPADQVFAQPQPIQVQQQPITTTVNSPIVDAIDVGPNVRPVRARKAPERLVVGNPLDARFNRTRGQ